METILDSLAGPCLKKLQQIITEEAVLILGVEQDLIDLQQKMNHIQFFIHDAEQRRMEDLAVNNWLGELRDAMYDADDIIDSARFEGSKLLPDHPSASRNSTGCSGISFLSCFSGIQKQHDIAVKIRDLNIRIEKISNLGKSFLKWSDAEPAGHGSTKQTKSSSIVESNLVGKEIIHSSRKLVDLVLEHKESKDYKLAIVGTGGVGKTTLAQKIYNDKNVQRKFNKYAWICVSQDYNDINILKELLRNIGVKNKELGETIAELHRKLAETIQDQSFFLVLDDVWKSDIWTNLLRNPLKAAAAAVILVTTRDDTIARKIGAGYTHRVDLMSTEVGWELLWRSMDIKEEQEVENLRDIGIEIVRKCGCLPLAVKVTASVLASKDQTENEWKKILSKGAWSQSYLPKEIEGALYLSYQELPHHLKQCFLYCGSMYPEDYIIFRDDITGFWVAEGFVQEQQGQLLEETAHEYYYELISRNLLQPDIVVFNHSRCKMHDLLRQLACYLSREEYFFGDPESLGGKNKSKMRRMLVVTNKNMLAFPSMDKGELKVRTLRKPVGLSFGVDHSFLKKLFLLRVLDLSDSTIESIPDCIEKLIHMRLLDLDRTGISCIPESIGSLINLQILNLQGCNALHSLPLAITKLYNLRRLGLVETPINQVPKGIGRLEFLNDLEGFPVGGGSDNGETQDGWQLEELRRHSQLRKLVMIKLERAIPCGADPLLANKKHLKVMKLACSEPTEEAYADEAVHNIEKIFEQLIPPRNLEYLLIFGLFSRRYPGWLGTAHLSSLRELTLRNCKFWEHLPPIGRLPNLKYLNIVGATAVTKVGPEFVGCTEAVAFPKLEWLMIRDMPNWEEWSFTEEEEDAAGGDASEGGEDGYDEMEKRKAPSPNMRLLPRLSVLNLDNCPKLRALPRQLEQMATSLKQLKISGAGCLQAVEDLPFLSEHLWVESCGGLERVSKLPHVTELRVSDCIDLRRVEELGNLRQLWLDEDMEEISSYWVPGLQQQHRQLYDEDLDIYAW